MWPARRVVYRNELIFSPRTLGRQETEGIVFGSELLSQVIYFFSPYLSYSPNSGHKNCSEFCLVSLGEVYWMSEFIKSSFWLFSLLSNGPLVGCCIHFSSVSLFNSQFVWFLQVVMSLPLYLASSLSTVPLWSYVSKVKGWIVHSLPSIQLDG